MQLCFVLVALVAPIHGLSVGREVHTEDAVILKPGNSSLSGSVNLRGLGYYYTSFYQDKSCDSSSMVLQEGYVTGKCLQLKLSKKDKAIVKSPSVRFDCSGIAGKKLEC